MPVKNQMKPDSEMHSDYHKMRVNGKQTTVARYIMEQKLGRPLQVGECVHHINGNRYDDRPENLEIMKRRDHSSMHHLGRPNSRKGIPLSSETKAKISASCKGYHHTSEALSKISASSRKKALLLWLIHYVFELPDE